MDFSNKFESKKLIKSRFEYDLDRILAGPRLDHISLDMSTVLQAQSKHAK